MILLANLLLDPAALAAWVGSGLGVGWLIGRFTDEPSYGSIGDLVLGGIGGLIGGMAFGFFKGDAGIFGSIAVAVGVAILFVASGRVIVARSSG